MLFYVWKVARICISFTEIIAFIYISAMQDQHSATQFFHILSPSVTIESGGSLITARLQALFFLGILCVQNFTFVGLEQLMAVTSCLLMWQKILHFTLLKTFIMKQNLWTLLGRGAEDNFPFQQQSHLSLSLLLILELRAARPEFSTKSSGKNYFCALIICIW